MKQKGCDFTEGNEENEGLTTENTEHTEGIRFYRRKRRVVGLGSVISVTFCAKDWVLFLCVPCVLWLVQIRNLGLAMKQ